LHEFDEPFVFPSQVQQMFFWSEPKTLWWKVVLGREPRSRQVVTDTYDDCIDTHSVVYGFKAPLKFPDLDSSRILIGVIELNREETFLATQALWSNLGLDDGA